jgi:hypothetical protein
VLELIKQRSNVTWSTRLARKQPFNRMLSREITHTHHFDRAIGRKGDAQPGSRLFSDANIHNMKSIHLRLPVKVRQRDHILLR